MATIQRRDKKDGRVSYRVQVRLKGQPAVCASFERKTDARRWVQQTEAAIRQGRYFKHCEAVRYTLRHMVERYIREVLPLKPKSLQRQRAQLMWWAEEFGAYNLADMTPIRVAEGRNRLLAEHTCRGKLRSPSTVVRYLAVLSHMFNIGLKEWGWVDSNPVVKVSKPKEPRGRVRFLSDDERGRLLAKCRASSCKALYPIVVLAIGTGMRQGEILGLCWKDVDFRKGQITLHETKNGEVRSVPLEGYTLKTLRAWGQVRRLDCELVFPRDSGTGRLDLRGPWRRALEQAAITEFRFHDLRHSAASYLAMNGATPTEIADVLGHKTLQMVKRYAHLSESHTKGVVASMNEQIFGERQSNERHTAL